MVMRRTLLKSVAAGAALTVYAGTVGGLKAFAQSNLRVRRSLHNMKLDDPDLATYRDFVKWMKAQDQRNALSWLGYASQHGTLTGGYKYCPHGDWYFLPWHRGFVLMYEQAAASLMNNPGFAMPYWDWTLDRSVPEAFATPTYNNAANPLYIPARNNSLVLTDDVVGQSVMDQVYADTPFQKFGTSKNPGQNNTDPSWVPAGGGMQGTLERTPHNLVHNSLGGYMPTPASPRDPIFMMHHSNIDRIWANWNAMGNQNETDPLWLTMAFQNNYLRPDGTPYSMKVSDLLSTAALGYTYQDLAVAKNISVNASRNLTLLDMLARKKKPSIKRSTVASKTRMTGDTLFRATSNLAEHSAKSVLTESAPKEAFAILTDVQLGEKTLGVRVFVNLENAPDQHIPVTDPHFVATISFLAHKKVGPHAHHKAPPATAVDLAPALRKLAAANLLKSDKISVQLLPVAMPGALYEDATVSVGTVEIVLI